MNSFFFWNQWRASYRLLYLFGLLNLLVAIGFYLFYFWMGNDMVIAWDKVGEIEVIKVITHQFSKNFFSFAAPIDAYLIKESFVASDIALDYLPYYTHFFFLMLGFLFFLTAISDLKRIGYFAGVLITVLFFASMQLEILGLFSDINDKLFLIIILLAYCPLSYYFHFFNKNVIFLYRFLIYLVITIGLVYIGVTYSEKETNILYPLNYGLFVPIVLATLFICFNAHENIRGMLTLVSQGSDNKSFRHLSILVVIYMLNLIYCYFYFTEGFDLDIFFIHPLFLILSTTLVGLWGFKARESTYAFQLPFAPTGAFLYLGLAIITISSIGFALGTANDPLIEVYEDVSMYAHFSWGFVIYAYIIANFIDPLSEGKPVYKFFYRHNRLDFLSAFFFGFVLLIALVFKSGAIAYKQAFAGYYNGLGDVSHVEKDVYTSKQYYNLALGYDTRNHRSYYSLGSIAREEGNRFAASIFFADALQKRPSPYAYANIAQFQLSSGKLLEALLTLKDGVALFPQSGELQNNLALIFNKTEVSDSVFYYFDAAQRYAKMPEVPASNLYALLTKFDYLSYLDTTYQWQNDDPYVTRAGNQFAFYNKYNRKEPRALERNFLPDSSLNTLELCYLYNYAINQASFADDSLVSLLKFYENRPENDQFLYYLQLARALILFEKGELKEAFSLMKEAYRYAGFTNQEYPNLLGLWYYESEEYLEATNYFRTAWQRGYQPAGLNLGLALSELEDKTDALEHWTLLKRVGTAEQKKIAADMLYLISPDSLETDWYKEVEVTDANRFRSLHYNQHSTSSELFQKTLETIALHEYKVAALAERILFLVDNGASKEAADLTQQMQTFSVSTQVKPLYARALLAYWNAEKIYSQEFTELLNTTAFERVFRGLKPYYEANYLASQEKVEESIISFKKAITTLPFDHRVYSDLTKVYNSIDSLDLGYSVALDGVRTNERSPKIWKNYVLQCAKLDYTTFAEDGLGKLKILLPENEYNLIEAQYRKKKEDYDKSLEGWQ